MTATLERPTERRPQSGGGPARRAIVRWAWRLFRREWRQQVLVLSLLVLAVAATTLGGALATSATKPPQTTVSLDGSDPQLAADTAAIHARFGPVEVIAHHRVPVPGSTNSVDLRAQDATRASHPALRLLSGRYAAAADEVAMTHGAATTLGLRLGDVWSEGGRVRHLVGYVENPLNLNDQFALVPPGQANPPSVYTIPLNVDPASFRLHLPSGLPTFVEGRSRGGKAAATAGVLAVATIGLLFVGLVAVAGFTVVAQRHLRALGMLGSLGATDSHVRLVMLANGAVVGAVGALAGSAIGVGSWVAFAPRFETMVAHRIDRFALPWLTIAAAMALAVVTAVGAAWWPARSVARIPVVSALSGRPPRPQPAHRFAVLGAASLVVGLGVLAWAHEGRPLFLVAGSVATTLGVLFLAPLAIRGLAQIARRSPVAIRLALRDLARYQARSGAALGAVTLALGIAATIAISAASQAAAEASGPSNLAANQLMVYIGGNPGGPVPVQTAAQVQALQPSVDRLATALGTHDVLPLEEAVDPTGPDIPRLIDGQAGKDPAALVKVTPRPHGFDESMVATLYVATPDVLAHFGIKPAAISPNADIVTSRTNVAGLKMGPARNPTTPRIQTINLPAYTSAPNALVTPHALKALGLQPVPVAWLIQTPRALTNAQILTAGNAAAAAGLSIETRNARPTFRQLRNVATGIGMLVALGVLAMTVGLIRSETANDLRTLAATGASSSTRRTLTGATAGALALLGALLATAGAYLALAAWHHSHLGTLTHVPITNLVVIIVGLPLTAMAAGWLLAGREPSTIGRQPID